MDQSIEEFMKRVRDVTKTRGKQIVLPLADAQDLALAIGILLTKVQEPPKKEDDITVQMDGGEW